MGVKDNFEPELEYRQDSEIAAVIDISTIGADGVLRPVLINQGDQEFMALTLEDAIRLHEFLGIAIQFLREYRDRIQQ